MSLTLVSLMLLTATCSGDDAEVPVRVEGFSEDDARWLRAELAAWVEARERRVCDGAGGLTLQLGELEAVISFEFKGQRRERSVSRTDGAELFRYQVAAAAEELVRSTWEAPPPPRFGLFARGGVAPLGVGPLLAGGGAGAEWFVHPALGLELSADGGALTRTTLPTGGEVSGSVVRGALAVSWVPVRVGVLRAGLRVGGQAGALTLAVKEETSVSATTPWLGVSGGACVGLEFKRLAVGVVGEVGAVLLGGAVLAEGVPVLRVRGLFGDVSLRVGVRW
ncbi:MAG: hypothetical protein ACOZQL_26365 [Myxococcota bacterium]